MNCIAYKRGYRYQLADDYSLSLEIKPPADLSVDGFLFLSTEGRLTIKKGYAWDGPSGPTVHSRTFMRGSLVHDALYQLMRHGKLDRDRYREPADRLLQALCREDGMSRARAWWVYTGVRVAGASAARSDRRKKVIRAPKRCGKAATRHAASGLPV